ncbi:MAG: tyrosine-protein phosphatase [Oscillospiraceae bacterium]
MQQERCIRLTVEGVNNVRDIGGYPDREGNPVATGRFLRCAELHNITPTGKDTLRALGVDCLIDLRSTSEAKRHPDSELGLDAEAHHIPMLDHFQSNLTSGDLRFPATMLEMYIDLLADSGEQFRKEFALFARGFHTVIFHCTAGKDRTGITAMLLLGLVGVSEEDIAYDYGCTTGQLDFGPVAKMPGIPRFLFESEPQTMMDTMDWLRRQYGSQEGYLRGIGVTEEELDNIRGILTGERKR